LVAVTPSARRPGASRAREPHPLWATELSWFSKPPRTNGLPPVTQARWLEQGLYLLWKQGASVAINFLLRDTKRVTSFSGASRVFFYDGQQKPSYTSFRFP